MPITELGMAAIGAGLDMFGSLFNSGMSYAQSKKLMRYQSELNQQMIDRANAYNTPTAQVGRLLDAGLNPNLAYGSGISGNTSPTSSVGLGRADAPKLDILGSMRSMADLKIAKEQAQGLALQNEHQALENDRLRAEKPYWEPNARYKSETLNWLNWSAESKAKEDDVNLQLSYIIRDAQTGVKGRTYANFDNMISSVTPLYSTIVDELKARGLKDNEIQMRIKKFRQDMRESVARIALMAKQGQNLDMRTNLLGLEERMKKTIGVSYNDGLGWRLLSLALHYLGIGPEDIANVLGGDVEPKDPVSRGASIGY